MMITAASLVETIARAPKVEEFNDPQSLINIVHEHMKKLYKHFKFEETLESNIIKHKGNRYVMSIFAADKSFENNKLIDVIDGRPNKHRIEAWAEILSDRYPDSVELSTKLPDTIKVFITMSFRLTQENLSEDIEVSNNPRKFTVLFEPNKFRESKQRIISEMDKAAKKLNADMRNALYEKDSIFDEDFLEAARKANLW
jgi:hypothetical protein